MPLQSSTNSVGIHQLSFWGFYEPAIQAGQAVSDERERPLYTSLVHWFESEKFRGTASDHRMSVMLAPTAKEARKVARRHQAAWRSDWPLVRSARLVEGMYYAMASDQEADRWREGAAQISQMLEPLALPQRFTLQAAEMFCAMRDGRRYVFLASASTPPEVIGKRVNAIHRVQSGKWSLVFWPGRRAQWRLQDWATQQSVPCLPYGIPDARHDDAALARAMALATHAVVFERKGGRSMDDIIAAIRQAGVPLELELYRSPSEDEQKARQLF